MSQEQSQSKNIEPQSLSYSVSYFTSTPSQKNNPKEEPIQSSSQQIDSSSHNVYRSHRKQDINHIKSKKTSNKQKKKNKKKNNNSKSKSKSKTKTKSSKEKQNALNKISITLKNNKGQETKSSNNKNGSKSKNQQKPKHQPTLNKFLGKKSEDQAINDQINDQIQTQKVATYNLHPFEANYLTRFQLYKGYSIQKIDQNSSQKPYKGKITYLKQRTMNRYLKYQKKQSKIESQQSEDLQQERIYSKSYIIIRRILKEMLDCEKFPKFFKQPIDNIVTSEAQLAYYQKYKQIIDNPLDLGTIEEMMDRRQIRNLIEFQGVFNEMISNSHEFHTLVNNQKMLQLTFQLQQMYLKMMTQLAFPHINELQKSAIKTTAFIQRPKIKKVSIEGEDKQIDQMDLNDPVNQHRITVMNYFLKDLSQKNPQNIHTFISRIKNLIQRYTTDKVEVIKQSGIQNKVNQYALSKRSFSPKSINSQNESNNQIYQISFELISVSLFQQLKELIKSEIRELKNQYNKGQQIKQMQRNVLYPHDDSEDFNSMNESDYS